jgi:hypothetical protein
MTGYGDYGFLSMGGMDMAHAEVLMELCRLWFLGIVGFAAYKVLQMVGDAFWFWCYRDELSEAERKYYGID